MSTEAAIGDSKQIQPALALTTRPDHQRSCNNAVCIHHLFEAQVRKTPAKLAVADQQEALTYDELNIRANQLAHYLKCLGVGSEVLVGICLDRSIDLIVGILAVLKAGGAYVPLDPTYPRERLVGILNDAQITVVLTMQGLQQWLFEEYSTEDLNTSFSASLVNAVVCLDEIQETIAAQSQSNPVTDTNAHHLAYVIYTSGSTGTPKGVMIEHRSLVSYAQAAATQYQLCETDRMLQFCSIGFDAAIEEIFCSLIRGTTLVLRTDAMLSTIQTFLSQCEALGITVLSLPTAFWHCLTDELAKLVLPNSLRLVIIGGERAMPERFALWQQRAGQVQLFNTYGPTETTVVATVSDLSSLELTKQGELPIGYPLGATTIRVLNELLQPVDVGEVGELYLGGVCVARGYMNRPALTAERFIQLPDAPGDRFYRTGDRVRQRSDGQLEFVGRVDHQVKIRGFRVELFEIEAALMQEPTVQDAVVVVTEGISKQLIAYVVLHSTEVHLAASNPSRLEQKLREFLKPKLPHYMIPSALVVLDKLPLTPSGKVDRRQLPQPHYRIDTAVHRAPRTRMEAQLVELWSRVLGMRAIGVSDHFFELGGNSLLTVTLLTQITDAFQVEVPVAQFYANPTVEGLAQWIESAQAGHARSLHPIDLAAEVVLSSEVTGHGKTLHWVDEPRSILLTGATGFLGAFLLHELLQTQATIYCLVRCAHPQEGLTKLQQILENYQIRHADLNSRVVVIPGNLEQPQLGLSNQQFDELAGTIDRIYHSGATVDFIKPYSLLKAANVSGTEEILKLACRKRLIPVHHISTIGIFGAIGYFTGKKVVHEEIDIDVSLPFLPVDDGYAQSKWVAEKRVNLARSRGVPVSIYRPGFIVGHRQTGAHNPKDYISRIMKGCIQMGCSPDFGTCKEQMISVDYASQAIVHLASQPEQLGKTFHITPPPGQDLPLADLFELLRYYGYTIEKQPYSQWKTELIQQVKQSPDNALYPLLPLLTEKVYQDQFTLVELYSQCPDYDCQNTLKGLQGTSIAFSPVKSQVLNIFLPHLIRNGFIDPPSLKFQLGLEVKAVADVTKILAVKQ
ncbi:non-ribosomal peptide synthetase family protein [Egbenema bharatensis]|uniref:non-ribosomal peptide synthetase family protein n=1 Tax=Egbenema bharatensis TaxID=3463334 RepID=UPI003A8C84E4